MYFLKKFLNRQSYRFIGRGGMYFFDGVDEYYVDSENYVPNSKSKNNYAVVIIQKGIKYKTIKKEISEEQKNFIAIKLQSFLAKDNIISTIE